MRIAHGIVAALIVVAMCIATGARAQDPSCPARDRWPQPDWASLPSSSSSSSSPDRDAAAAALDAYAFTLVGDDSARLGIRSDAVIVIQSGVIVYERYARGFDATKKHLAWSVTKSLTNAAVGVAVKEGLLSTSDSICRTIPDLPKAACAVTVDHLLEMASGFDWSEGYEDAGTLQHSSVLAALYGQGYRDIARFNARHGLREAPGTSWLYSSGDTVTLSLVLKAAMAKRFGERFYWGALFEPMGATRVTVEQDAAGTFVGGSYWYSAPRDAARLGYLFLNDGCWNGTRLLPEGWVKQSTTVNEAFKKKRLKNDPEDVYGRLWWLNRAVPEGGIPLPFKDLPDDLYAARGHWGQSVTVAPSQDVVVVRFADDRDDAFDFNRFHALALAVAAASGVTPPTPAPTPTPSPSTTEQP
jgi:CubicO group peptidase (beta-lactamase class C family)